ncbi:MAG: isoprenylcysteine carboxylmethyltransferase family protein [Atribacterota bacterium]|nr:isoprenylcysteine carboxylmethyltransferase family protein [Atribacterota bacterium]
MAFINKQNITKYLLTFILTIHSVFIFGLALFLSSGNVKWFKGWLFLILFGISTLITSFIRIYKNPEINYRKKEVVSENQEWDTIAVSLLGLNTFILLITAGFDEKLSLYNNVPDIVSYLVLPFTSIYLFVQLWANSVNKYFEGQARIQEGQTVIEEGPYAIVRHLYYSASILFWISTPLALGSYLALVPGLIGALLMFYRTTKEDKFLMENLDGYRKYANKVQYKLFPGIW